MTERRKNGQTAARKGDEVGGIRSERLVIDKLHSLGIFAVQGRWSKWRRIDVVAWGCVRLEVKSSSERDGVWLWGMGHKEGPEAERSDLVVLVALDATGEKSTGFFVLPSEHPCFYHPDGSPKKGLVFLSNPRHFKRKAETRLTEDILEAHRDAWHLIEERRVAISRQLRGEG